MEEDKESLNPTPEEIADSLDGDVLARAFGFEDEKRRALQGLRGILAGVVADRQLNEKELLFLDVWLQSQQFLSRDEDVLGLLRLVSEVIATGTFSGADLEQARARMERFLGETPDAERPLSQMRELYGFITGIASDGVLNDAEISSLSSWLERHRDIHKRWPASVLLARIKAILADGKITEQERQDLLITLQGISRGMSGNDGGRDDLSIEESIDVWEDRLETIAISGSRFCLTGDFIGGDREAVEHMLRLRGGAVSPSLNGRVDFLVIGTLASRDWLYSAHGRKIEKVLLQRLQGSSQTSIITERSLFRHLR